MFCGFTKLLANHHLGRLQKGGGQKIDLISLILNTFLRKFAYINLLPIQTQKRNSEFFIAK